MSSLRETSEKKVSVSPSSTLPRPAQNETHSDSSFSSTFSSFFSAAAAGAAPPVAAAGAADDPPPEGTDASLAEPAAMSSLMSLPESSAMTLSTAAESAVMLQSARASQPHHLGFSRLDGDALDRGEERGDVLGRGGGVATGNEEEVRGDVLHLCAREVSCVVQSLSATRRRAGGAGRPGLRASE